jgi:hypothetical protein
VSATIQAGTARVQISRTANQIGIANIIGAPPRSRTITPVDDRRVVALAVNRIVSVATDDRVIVVNTAVIHLTNFSKDPDSILDYGIDLGTKRWLADGEAIQSATWTIPDELVQPADADHQPFITPTEAVTWLSGGTSGQSYTVTCRITTTQFRTEDFSFIVVCEQH